MGLVQVLCGGAGAVRIGSPTVAGARVVVVAVHDGAVASVARRLAAAWPAGAAPAVLHTAGARSAAELRPLARLARGTGVFHPVVALLGAASAERLGGAIATISGDRSGLAAARALARALGMRPLRVEDRRRPVVHAAAVLAAGDLVALLGEAERLLVHAGVRRRTARVVLSALAGSAVAGYSARGVSALTGPVARADAATLGRHVKALGPGDRSVAAIHAALVRSGARQLCRAGVIDRATARRIDDAVSSGPSLPGVRRARNLPS